MILSIDQRSDEPLYLQIRDQVIEAIARGELVPGQALPSVRSLASDLGINLHTVNKAYSLLKQEGYIRLDRRCGAVVAVDVNKRQAIEELKRELLLILAKGSCKNITCGEVHALIDEIYAEYGE